MIKRVISKWVTITAPPVVVAIASDGMTIIIFAGPQVVV
jgi:hypothetical protein